MPAVWVPGLATEKLLKAFLLATLKGPVLPLTAPWLTVSTAPLWALVKTIPEAVAAPLVKVTGFGKVGAVLLGELAAAVPLQVRVWVPP